jgi:hypothetical protein
MIRVEISDFDDPSSLSVDINCVYVSLTKKTATYAYTVACWTGSYRETLPKGIIINVPCTKGRFPIIQRVLKHIDTDPAFCHIVPIEPGENRMLLSDFIEGCERNEFLDGDGFGEYATRARKATGYIVRPSDVENETIDHRWSHIVWYNQKGN